MTLPDIDSSNKYYNDVIKLYNAGIISGNDYRGTFTPKANITRAEVAAIASRLALPSTRIQLTFCKSIALPSEDNSFGELKKIGTQVISREERDRQRAEEQKQKEQQEKEQQEKQQQEQAQREKEKEQEQSSNKSNDNRYNYNYTWDYETNSPVDDDEVKRLQREHGYNSTTDDNREDRDDRKESTSSNKTPSNKERDDDIYWEFDGKIYYSEEEWKAAAEAALDKSTKEIAEEEQWNIEHYAEETLKLVNEARAEEGLPSLTLDPDLVEAAEIRARELSELRSHTRPNGSSWSTIIDEYTSYFFGGENIASGGAVGSRIQGWLDSPGHRKEILNDKVQYYGAAAYVDENGSTFFVQLFGGN